MCFYCVQKYRPGHKCEGQLSTLLVLAENEECEEYHECLEQEDELEEIIREPQISLNALTGVQNYRTIRIKRIVSAGISIGRFKE